MPQADDCLERACSRSALLHARQDRTGNSAPRTPDPNKKYKHEKGSDDERHQAMRFVTQAIHPQQIATQKSEGADGAGCNDMAMRYQGVVAADRNQPQRSINRAERRPRDNDDETKQNEGRQQGEDEEPRGLMSLIRKHEQGQSYGGEQHQAQQIQHQKACDSGEPCQEIGLHICAGQACLERRQRSHENALAAITDAQNDGEENQHPKGVQGAAPFGQLPIDKRRELRQLRRRHQGPDETLLEALALRLKLLDRGVRRISRRPCTCLQIL